MPTALSPSTTVLVARLKALADPTRLRLLQLLAGGERCVCDLHQPLGLAQNLASHHLRVLREADLVSVRRDSRWAYYSLRDDRLDALLAEVDAFVADAPPADAPDCCA